ncbi:hypothetical protein KAR48_13270 [bacterium]|nr:hypothetical protein [bacterium]
MKKIGVLTIFLFLCIFQNGILYSSDTKEVKSRIRIVGIDYWTVEYGGKMGLLKNTSDSLIIATCDRLYYRGKIYLSNEQEDMTTIAKYYFRAYLCQEISFGWWGGRIFPMAQHYEEFEAPPSLRYCPPDGNYQYIWTYHGDDGTWYKYWYAQFKWDGQFEFQRHGGVSPLSEDKKYSIVFQAGYIDINTGRKLKNSKTTSITKKLKVAPDLIVDPDIIQKKVTSVTLHEPSTSNIDRNQVYNDGIDIKYSYNVRPYDRNRMKKLQIFVEHTDQATGEKKAETLEMKNLVGNYNEDDVVFHWDGRFEDGSLITKGTLRIIVRLVWNVTRDNVKYAYEKTKQYEVISGDNTYVKFNEDNAYYKLPEVIGLNDIERYKTGNQLNIPLEYFVEYEDPNLTDSSSITLTISKTMEDGSLAFTKEIIVADTSQFAYGSHSTLLAQWDGSAVDAAGNAVVIDVNSLDKKDINFEVKYNGNTNAVAKPGGKTIYSIPLHYSTNFVCFISSGGKFTSDIRFGNSIFKSNTTCFPVKFFVPHSVHTGTFSQRAVDVWITFDGVRSNMTTLNHYSQIPTAGIAGMATVEIYFGGWLSQWNVGKKVQIVAYLRQSCNHKTVVSSLPVTVEIKEVPSSFRNVVVEYDYITGYDINPVSKKSFINIAFNDAGYNVSFDKDTEITGRAGVLKLVDFESLIYLNKKSGPNNLYDGAYLVGVYDIYDSANNKTYVGMQRHKYWEAGTYSEGQLNHRKCGCAVGTSSSHIAGTIIHELGHQFGQPYLKANLAQVIDDEIDYNGSGADNGSTPTCVMKGVGGNYKAPYGSISWTHKYNYCIFPFFCLECIKKMQYGYHY